MKRKITQAIDHSLSGLSVSQYNRKQIFSAIEGEEPVKKKLTFGLVMALALVMITIGAMAAVLLSGKDLVDQKITPMAEKTSDSRFTPEEIDEILAFAEKNEITLSQEDLKML